MATTLAELDFTAGLKLRNFQAPRMPATVKLENPDAFKGYDTKKEKVVVQALIEEAYAGLRASQKEIQDALRDFDEGYGKQPPADEAEKAQRLKELESACRQITLAQQARVERRVEDRWELQRKRDSALTKLNLRFAAQITLNTISIAASAAVAALSLGTLAVTLVGAAKTIVSTAVLIKGFAEDRDKAAQEVYALDQALWKIYMGPKMKGKAFRTAEEVASAVGVPFIPSVGKLESLVEDFLGKSARVDDQRQALYEQANKLMAVVAKIDAAKAGPDNAKKLATLGKHVTTLLDRIHELARSVAGDDAFHQSYVERVKAYHALDGRALATAPAVITLGALAVGIALTAKSIVDVASALA